MALETAPNNSAFTRNHTEEATIADEATTSDEFIVGGRAVVNIHLPTLDAAYISYLVKINPGDTAVVLVDESGDTLTFPRGSSATTTGALTYQEPRLSGIYSVQIVTSAAQNGGPRTIGISARGQNPIPTITDIEATIEGGGDVVVIPSGNADAAASQYTSTAAEDNALIKNAAGNLYGFTVASTTAQFVQLHNTATAPSGGAVPMRVWPIAANGTTQVAFNPPLRFSAGIWIGNSSTLATWTDAGDDCLFGAQYV